MVLYVLAVFDWARDGYTLHMNELDQRELAKMWRAQAFGGLELMRARFFRFKFAPHVHDETMIVVTGSGTGQPYFRGEVHRIVPGDVVALRPGEPHEGGPALNSTWRYRSFYVTSGIMARVAQELGSVPQFAGGVIHDPAAASALRAAHVALEESASELARESMLLDALVNLMKRHAAGNASPRREGDEHRAVRVVRDYLESLPKENVSLETLAREANLSPYRLCRVFRRDTGMSPHAYQILVRARHAKSLLMTGLPIAQAAAEAGFFDQAHLTRHFKRIYGVTPGQYLA